MRLHSTLIRLWEPHVSNIYLCTLKFIWFIHGINYTVYIDTPSWPRGLPLSHIKPSSYIAHGNPRHSYVAGSKHTYTLYGRPKVITLPARKIGRVQSLANTDPDVDAIYRLPMPIPFNFTSKIPYIRSTQGTASAHDIQLLKVPDRSYAPYIAQATLHSYSALWSLLLPVTVYGRISDIWRGYIYQRLAKDLGLSLLFASPAVAQVRNVHNYLADFDSEQALYRKADRLIEQLSELTLTGPSLPSRMEALYVYLYERGYIELADVELCQEWLSALISVGYTFPSIVVG